jgi:hypothetical protein
LFYTHFKKLTFRGRTFGYLVAPKFAVTGTPAMIKPTYNAVSLPLTCGSSEVRRLKKCAKMLISG